MEGPWRVAPFEEPPSSFCAFLAAVEQKNIDSNSTLGLESDLSARFTQRVPNLRCAVRLMKNLRLA